MSFVAIGYQPPEQIKAAASAVDVNTSSTSSVASQSLTVDDLVAARVATQIAETADLPVANNVASLSQSMAAESVLVQNDANIVAKPQVVQAAQDTRQITTYTAKTGETIPDIAKLFGISAQTVRWANDMESDAVEPGRNLKILPIDGVLYTIQSSDTLASVASKYKANAEQIKTYNDLELGGFTAGKQIIIPQGTLPTDERPGYEAPVVTNGIAYGSYGGGTGSSNTYSASTGNKYAFGNCTWYVYERRQAMGRPVGSFWGNGSMWKYSAQAAGYTVNKTPLPGSIFQTAEGGGGYGHVAIVDSVDGAGNIVLREMNYAGFNVISSRSISASDIQNRGYWFIH